MLKHRWNLRPGLLSVGGESFPLQLCVIVPPQALSFLSMSAVPYVLNHSFLKKNYASVFLIKMNHFSKHWLCVLSIYSLNWAAFVFMLGVKLLRCQ